VGEVNTTGSGWVSFDSTASSDQATTRPLPRGGTDFTPLPRVIADVVSTLALLKKKEWNDG